MPLFLIFGNHFKTVFWELLLNSHHFQIVFWQLFPNYNYFQTDFWQLLLQIPDRLSIITSQKMLHQNLTM